MVRLLALASVTLTLIGLNLMTRFDCNVSWLLEYSLLVPTRLISSQAWLRCVLVSSWFAVAIASFLLVLRG
jgi:hypothetical protein